MAPITVNYEGYIITTDKEMMKPHDVHQWLSEKSYWAKSIPFDIVKLAMEHSYCIAALHDGKQIAYGRLVTDYATLGYLADVFVAEEHRGRGISKKMMEIIFSQDWVKGLRGIKLGTLDAHGLYKQFGFTECAHPDRIMEILRPGIYEQQRITNLS